MPPCTHPLNPIAPQTIVARMGSELERFQAERAREAGCILRDFALAQARLAGDSARVWGSLLGSGGGGGGVAT